MAQSKYWCFTVNNYGPEEEKKCQGLVPEHAAYLVYGREVGESGTPHLQGYIELLGRKRRGAVLRLPGLERAALFQRRGNSTQAATYCKKEGDVFEAGTVSVPTQGKRNDLLHCKQLLDAGESFRTVAEECFGTFVRYGHGLMAYKRLLDDDRGDLDDVTGVWIWGPPGVGKSHKARAEYPDPMMKMMNKWWDGYTDQDYVLLDDLDKGGKCLGHHLKLWADRYAFPMEVKGGTRLIRPKKFVVTSNYSIEDIWDDDENMAAALKRRFHVIYCPVKLY